MSSEIIVELQKLLVKRFNILIIDDTPDVLGMLCEHFNLMHYFNILSARHYDEAVAIIESKHVPLHFSLVYILLPRKSGLDLLERYKKNNGFKIAISGEADFEDGGEAVRLGALACVRKAEPDTLDRLTDLVCGYLPISFCSNGKCTTSRELFAEIHQEGIFNIKDWVGPTESNIKALRRECNKQLGIPPQYFIYVSYGLYYLFYQHKGCKLLEKYLTPLANKDIIDQCLVSLYEYCCDKLKN